jgi:prepilin-type N-terminal cleavage/methylation domain-containing protein
MNAIPKRQSRSGKGCGMQTAACTLINSNAEIQNLKSKGFSLIEIIITLAVLAIAAGGVLAVFSMGIGSSATPLVTDQAVQLAQGELEAVIGIKMASGFSAAALGAGTGQACKTTMLPGFTCSLNICFVAAGSLNNTGTCTTATSYKQIAATVTNAAGGSVTTVTLLTNY